MEQANDNQPQAADGTKTVPVGQGPMAPTVVDQEGNGGLAQPSSPPRIPEHTLVFPVGHGSYGEVWLARNLVGTMRAVKIVYRRRFSDDRPYEREFAGIRKYEPVSRTHAGLVDILQLGMNDQEGYFYYVMELADDSNPQAAAEADGPGRAKVRSDWPTYQAKTLRHEVVRRGRLPLRECVEIGRTMSEALAHLHRSGLVHRDVKPSNIIFVNGKPQLADIGLVAGLGEARSYVGTEGFIPPEGPGTPQADLYALGKVLYEVSTGQDRTDFPRVPKELAQCPERELFAGLNEIVLKACADDPRQRYSAATEMASDLAALAGGISPCDLRTKRTGRLWLKRAGLALLGGSIILAGAFDLRIGLVTGLLVLLALGAAYLTGKHGARAKEDRAAPDLRRGGDRRPTVIAVLPFANYSPAEADGHLGEELAVELAHVLAKIEGLRVLPQNTARGLQSAAERLGAARQIKVDTLVEGSVRKTGRRLRVSAELVGTQDGLVTCSEVYEREVEEIFGIQTDLALRIAAGLELEIPESIRQQIASRATENLAAYDFYLVGRRYLNQRTPEGFLKAVEMFERAIQVDPEYPLAYAGLADAYQYLGYGFGRMPAREVAPKARVAALRAVELGPTLAEAHTALATVRWMLERNRAGADEAFQIAFKLNPNYPTAHHFYSIFLATSQGRFDEALAEARRALELDPLSLPLNNFTGVMLFFCGHLEETIQHQQQWLANVPKPAGSEHELSFAHKIIGRAAEGLGRHPLAVGSYLEEMRLHGVPAPVLDRQRKTYEETGWTGFCRGKLEGLESLWQKGNQPWFIAYEIACTLASLGDTAHAMEWLRQLYEVRCSMLIWIRIDPLLASLRDEPQLIELAGKIGLKLE